MSLLKIQNDKKVKSNRNNSKISRKNQNSTSKTNTDFKKCFSEINHKKIQARLDKLLDIVDKKGEKLKESLDQKDLLEYKKRVKDFLRLVQNEFVKAKQSFSWDDSGNVKTYTIIDQVDQNLDEIHNMFFEEQADVLNIINKIDEIRGLLMDIYR